MESFGDYFTIEKRDAYQPIKLVYVKKKETSPLDLETISVSEFANSDTLQDGGLKDSDVQEEPMTEVDSDLEGDLCTNVEMKE